MRTLEAAAAMDPVVNVPFPSPQEPFNVMDEAVLDSMLNLDQELSNVQRESGLSDLCNFNVAPATDTSLVHRSVVSG